MQRGALLSRGLPGNYRAGHLLTLLSQRDFNGFAIERTAPSTGVISEPAGTLHFTVRERVKKDFLCHTAIAVFELRVGEVDKPWGRIKIRHKGAMRRTGIGVTIEQDDFAVADTAERILSDAAVTKALLPLDFVKFQIDVSSGGWRAEMEHFGGSEVCMMLPPSRRYVPLGREQRGHLIAAFWALFCAMARH